MPPDACGIHDVDVNRSKSLAVTGTFGVALSAAMNLMVLQEVKVQ